MHPTRNNLPEAARAKLVEVLNSRLADAIDLFNQVKHAHWNVKGPHFIALHELFDQIAERAEDWSDDIAERAVQLGGTADGVTQSVAKRTSLAEYPVAATDGAEHVKLLADRLASFGGKVRAAIDLASELRDADTADLFTEVSRGVDKDVWFLESHLIGR
jgi:starvation-inducible DNA-binding protein